MTSSRSTLKLDLKDLTSKPAAPHIGRIGLVIVSAIAMVSTIASINSPSASTAMVVHYDRVKTEDIVSVRPAFPADTETGIESGNALSESPSPETQTINTSFRHGSLQRPQIHLAMLAPSPQSVSDAAVVNLVESHPISAAVIQHQPDDLGIEVEQQVAQAPVYAGPDMEMRSVHSTAAAQMAPGSVSEIRKESATEVVPTAALVAEKPLATQTTATARALVNDSALTDKAANRVAADETIPSGGDLPASDKVAAEISKWQVEKVRKKDTLSEIFNRLGLSSKEAFALAKRKDAKALTRIRPGQEIMVALAPSDKSGNGTKSKKRLEGLRVSLNKFDTLVITSKGDDYEITKETREPELEYRTTSAEIDSSLLGAAKSADIPSDIVYNLAAIFGWQIDFAKHIQPGDKFAVIYEQMLLDDEVVGHGQVVAAELITSGKTLRAVRHVDENSRVTYYAPDGEGIQGSFLRAPIKFARVTSKFSNRRLHPIHKTWKAHKGVDYGAPMKTPIRATGDGVVKFAGKKKGYGKTIVLSHGQKYRTLYAHMNGFKKGIKNGSRVKQGDIIGYVGRTGWATGPHLHYEFHINGKNKNPLTVELPKSLPIDQKYRKAFIAEAGKWVNNLERSSRISLAENRH